MNQPPVEGTILFPGPFSQKTSNSRLSRSILISVIIAECRKSCEDFAGTLDLALNMEHAVINDCIAACDEFSSAIARDSKHSKSYSKLCTVCCAELFDVCIKINSPISHTTAKWLQVVSRQFERDISSEEIVERSSNLKKFNSRQTKIVDFDEEGTDIRLRTAD